MKSKKKPHATGVLTIVLATVVVFFVAVVLVSRDSRTPQSAPDPMAGQKAQILAIVSSAEPLSAEQRDTLFLSLSGERMLRYHFTNAEKALIVKALNQKSSGGKSSSRVTLISKLP